MPTAHDVQLLVPVATALYAPTAQLVHVLLVLEPPTSAYAPGTQAVQAAVPDVSALYCPTAQLVHTVGAVAPAGVP